MADTPKTQIEALNTGRQSPSYFRVMVYFTYLQGHGTDGLTPPPSAQLGVGLNDSQDHKNRTVAKDVALWLM